MNAVLVPTLALSWAFVLAVPFVHRARRVVPAERASALAGHHAACAGSTARRWAPRVAAALDRLGARSGVRVLSAPITRGRAARADAELTRELPVAVDLLGVAVGAGCTPYLAVEHAARWAPAAIATELERVARACALGAGFADAWRDAAARVAALAPLADALTAGERTGAPVGPALARLAAEERAAARRRVESHARRVPVRLLFPLVFLVLPAFVVLTVVPGLAAGMARL